MSMGTGIEKAAGGSGNQTGSAPSDSATLSPHFTLSELTTSTHGENLVPAGFEKRLRRVAAKLEEARAILGAPLVISRNGGYRCPAVNQAVGGSDTSAHMFALASDFNAKGWEREDAFRALWKHPAFMQDVDQLILERGCIHMGLTLAQPRKQGRGDCDKNGLRHYPLVAIWPAALPDGRLL